MTDDRRLDAVTVGSETTTVTDQRTHWERTLSANPEMFGTEPSEPGRYAINRFASDGAVDVLELGAGQGRDTMALLGAGFNVHALDFAADAVADIVAAVPSQMVDHLTTSVHDVRDPLPFPDGSFDACYSHMLFTMALSSRELEALVGEIHRVLRPSGLCIYTVRHVGDAHFGTGRALGDNLFEHNGFVVHFFDRHLVEDLARGFSIEEVVAFEEGDLPRRLWRVIQSKS